MTKIKPNWKPVNEVTPEMDDKEFIIHTIKKSVFAAWYNAEMNKFVVACINNGKDYVYAYDITHFAEYEIELPEDKQND
jgi:hypothetical protein